MQTIVLRNETDWDGWRRVTRGLILAGVAPQTLAWTIGGEATDATAGSGSFQVPRELVSLAALAIQAREADRFGLLYGLFWRLHQGEKLLGGDPDRDLATVRRMALAVRADAHRMRTHMRYLAVQEGGAARFVGWFEPAHFVLAANAQLIVRRFPDLALSIVTPDGAAHWDRRELRFGSGLRQVADDGALRAWWEAEHETLLRAAVPGVSVPEAEALDEIPRPPDRAPLGPVVLHPKSDPALRDSANEAAGCQRCPLYEPATQTVFGEGPADAVALFVGEQPGDQEDTIGRPFVGPAGQIMDRAMEEAGLDRRMVYVTNAVKHFKFSQRGKRRIHQTPEVPEIQACKFWLDVERVHLRPRLVVLMGGSAARAGLGRSVTISRERGRPMRAPDGQAVFVTVHPSYLLRIPDAAAKAREYEAFVRDLGAIKALIAAEDRV
ncbi:UdgX family uracil-DNA binding protein [Rhodopila sp.]|uniref:UdgX family uracil-DNA binding protein n=1 Tax=Rhodopila sp. TaxID=2480087 RepID=UPI003D0EB426